MGSSADCTIISVWLNIHLIVHNDLSLIKHSPDCSPGGTISVWLNIHLIVLCLTWLQLSSLVIRERASLRHCPPLLNDVLRPIARTYLWGQHGDCCSGFSRRILTVPVWLAESPVGFIQCYYWLLLYSASLCTRADSLRYCRVWFWMSDWILLKHGFLLLLLLFLFFNIHRSGVLIALFGCCMADAKWNGCRLGASSLHTIQLCTHSESVVSEQWATHDLPKHSNIASAGVTHTVTPYRIVSLTTERDNNYSPATAQMSSTRLPLPLPSFPCRQRFWKRQYNLKKRKLNQN